MSFAVELGSDALISIASFLGLVQEFNSIQRGIHRDTDPAW
jgi:hypothetical protein